MTGLPRCHAVERDLLLSCSDGVNFTRPLSNSRVDLWIFTLFDFGSATYIGCVPLRQLDFSSLRASIDFCAMHVVLAPVIVATKPVWVAA